MAAANPAIHTGHGHDVHDDHDHKPHGFLHRWLFTTNHKDIGTLYLVFSLTMFFIGGSMAMVIRAELFKPGMQLVQPEFFNEMTTMHALIMIFGAVMPAFVGLGNWMIPLMIGATVQIASSFVEWLHCSATAPFDFRNLNIA